MFHAVKYMSIYVCSMAKIGYTNIWLTLETQKKNHAPLKHCEF